MKTNQHSAKRPTQQRAGAARLDLPLKAAAPSRRRLIAFRLLAAVVFPAIVLVLVEAGLHFFGYGHPTSFFLRKKVGQKEVLIENAWFGMSFFPPGLARSPEPLVIPAKKKPGTFRIFLFGESAALGDPRPAFGAGRYLATLMQKRFPGREFEVVCVAITAISSHAILPIASECARYEGDLWVIYMGNNEFVGPFGASTVFGPRASPRAFVRCYLAVQKTRLGQAAVELARRIAPTRTPSKWGGLKMFLDHQLAPQDPRRSRVYENFASNLNDILNMAKSAGIPVVVSSVASNLKDCSPFGSMHAPGSTLSTIENWYRLWMAGETNFSQGKFLEAMRCYEEAAKISPTRADVHFRLGQCFLSIRNLDDAARSFRSARDLDALPFRADSRINQIIAESAKQHAKDHVVYLDAEELLSGSGMGSIPGAENFLEHVHLTSEGNYKLARGFADRITNLLPGNVMKVATPQWACQQECDQALGLTGWNRSTLLEEIIKRVEEPPFTQQIDHALRMRQATSQLQGCRLQLQRGATERARLIYDQAIKERPMDHWIHHNFAEFLAAIGELPQAIHEMEVVRDLLPHHHAAYFQLGRLYAKQRDYASARASLQKALVLRPDVAEVHTEFGHILVATGELDEALKEFVLVRNLRKDDARVRMLIAQVLERQSKRDSAIQSLREAIQIQPTFWEAYELLGMELAMAERFGAAQEAFDSVVHLNPDYAEGHLNLGIALGRLGRMPEAIREFQTTLSLDPNHAKARELLRLFQQLKAQQDVSP